MDLVLIVILVILTSMLFLARRNPLIVLGRLLRLVTAPIRWLLRLLSFGSRPPGTKPSVSAPNFLASFNRPFHAATLTDRMMERVAHYSSCELNRTRGLLFEWLDPDEHTVPEHSNEIFHETAERNLNFARHFFHFDIPVNEALTKNLHEYLYEDVHSALIIKLFGGTEMTDDERRFLKGKTLALTPGVAEAGGTEEADTEDSGADSQENGSHECVHRSGPDDVFYYVVGEMRKTINANVRMLATYMSLIVLITFLVMVYAITGDNAQTAEAEGIVGIMPILLPAIDATAATESQLYGFNVASWLTFTEGEMKLNIFAIVICLVALSIMWLLYVATYRPYQNYNAIQLNQYIIRYFAFLSVDFNRSRSEAIRVIGTSDRMRPETDEDHDILSQDSQLYFINLQWTAFRVFFMEWFLRGIFYQVMRNGSYYLVFIPLAFVLAITLAMTLAMNNPLNADALHDILPFIDLSKYDLSKRLLVLDFGRIPAAFYPMFLVLLVAYYRYLAGSVGYIQRSVRERDWQQFHKLGLEESMSDVIKRYVIEIRRWQFKFGSA